VRIKIIKLLVNLLCEVIILSLCKNCISRPMNMRRNSHEEEILKIHKLLLGTKTADLQDRHWLIFVFVDFGPNLIYYCVKNYICFIKRRATYVMEVCALSVVVPTPTAHRHYRVQMASVRIHVLPMDRLVE